MARTVTVKQPLKHQQEDDSDTIALWVTLLVAFGVVLIAIVGFNQNVNSATQPEAAVTMHTTSAY